MALLLCGSVGTVLLATYLITVFVVFNFDEVVPGQVYRSAQPSPSFLSNVVRENHIRSIIKLNNEKESDWSRDEKQLAATLGVQVFHVGIGVTELPSRDKLIALVKAIDEAPRPLLIHCKTGADRTGLVSAIARMRNGDSFEQAIVSQLRLRYLHVGHLCEAVDDVASQYRADRARAGLPTGGWDEFKSYVLNDYYPGFYHAGIEPLKSQVTVGPGQRVNVKVRITNRSPHPWPDTWGHPMRLYLGRAKDGLVHGVRIPPLRPFESVVLRVPVRVPADYPPGTHELPFDIAHGSLTWFGLRGSPLAPLSITVTEPEMARSDHEDLDF